MLQHEWILRTFAKWNKQISHTHTHKIKILQDFTSMRFLFSFPVMSDSVTPQTAACQASLSPTIFQSLPKFMPIASVMPSSHLILWHPPSPSALNLSQHQGLSQWAGCSYQMTKILKLQLQSFQWVFRVDFPWDWLAWSPCCSRDSQGSSLATQFEGINSLVLCLIYFITLSNTWILKRPIYFWHVEITAF